ICATYNVYTFYTDGTLHIRSNSGFSALLKVTSTGNRTSNLLITKRLLYLLHHCRPLGILNQHGYQSILQRHAIPSGLRLVGPSFVFQQGNDPKHTSRLCKGYMTKKESDGVLGQMTWPPQSPNLKPVEMVWDELDRRVKEKQPVVYVAAVVCVCVCVCSSSSVCVYVRGRRSVCVCVWVRR